MARGDMMRAGHWPLEMGKRLCSPSSSSGKGVTVERFGDQVEGNTDCEPRVTGGWMKVYRVNRWSDDGAYRSARSGQLQINEWKGASEQSNASGCRTA